MFKYKNHVKKSCSKIIHAHELITIHIFFQMLINKLLPYIHRHIIPHFLSVAPSKVFRVKGDPKSMTFNVLYSVHGFEVWR